jgi:hypothetical protein
MSYDLNAYIKYEEKLGIKKQLIEYFKKYEFDIELHPDFDLEKADGFCPIVVKKSSKFWQNSSRKIDFDILSGCEMYFSKIDTDDEYYKEIPNKDITYELSTACCSGNIEIEISWLFCSAIMEIFGGIINDPQENGFVSGDEIKRILDDILQHLRVDIAEARLMKFNGWNSEEIASPMLTFKDRILLFFASKKGKYIINTLCVLIFSLLGYWCMGIDGGIVAMISCCIGLLIDKVKIANIVICFAVISYGYWRAGIYGGLGAIVGCVIALVGCDFIEKLWRKYLHASRNR